LLDPVDHETTRERLARLHEEKPIQQPVEQVWLRADGGTVAVEVSTGLVLWGGERAVQTLARDITERRVSQASLIASEQRFRTLAVATSDLVWTANQRGDRYTEVGARSSAAVLSVEQWLDAIHPQDVDRVRRHWMACVRSGEAYRIEYRLRRQDGSYRHMLSRGVPVRGQDGEIQEWVGITVDVTERRLGERERETLLGAEQAARADAERANRMKDEFLARVSHELATPLLGMRLWLSMLLSDPRRLKEGLEALQHIEQSQSKVVHDLLDTSRALAGKIRLSMSPCDPEGPLQAAVGGIRPLAEKKQVALEVSVAKTAKVCADAERLQQVFSNLLSNAIKFTPKGGTVRVALQTTGMGVGITVSDTGRGFPAEFKALLFEPFRQEEEGTTRGQGGLGLGLAIVRQIVDLHGGRVSAESAGRDRGATFTVWLPAMEAGADVNGPRDPVAEGLPTLSGLRILLVEDEELTRLAVRSVLEQHGAKVDSAPGAAAGLLALGRESYDLLLCDIAMPDEDGYSLIRKVRALAGPAANVPAAAFTAHMREEDRQRALSAGFQTHIPKSIDPGGLVAQLRLLTVRRSSSSSSGV
jgi:signal transduction histidine kinase